MRQREEIQEVLCRSRTDQRFMKRAKPESEAVHCGLAVELKPSVIPATNTPAATSRIRISPTKTRISAQVKRVDAMLADVAGNVIALALAVLVAHLVNSGLGLELDLQTVLHRSYRE